MDYILLMLKISSLQTKLILLRIPGGQFFNSSCLYSLFGMQKIFQFPTTVTEREQYFPSLGPREGVLIQRLIKSPGKVRIVQSGIEPINIQKCNAKF